MAPAADDLAPLRRTLGDLLAARRAAARLTQQQLAQAIGYSRVTVATAESGHRQPAAEFWTRCEDVLDAGGELAQAYRQLAVARGLRRREIAEQERTARIARLAGRQAAGGARSSVAALDAGTPMDAGADSLELVTSLRGSIHSAARLWWDDIARRELLSDAAFGSTVFAGPVLRWLTAVGDEHLSAATGRHVGEADVAALSSITQEFRRLDNRHGGGHVRSAVVGFLHANVGPLLREGRYDEPTGRSLLAAAAQLTHLAGWMAYDAEEHGLAQRYLVQALEFARGAGDIGFGGEVLAGMSHQAIYLGHADHGVDLARAARQTAVRAGIPALIAEAAVTEAHGHARKGDKTATAHALRVAETAFDRDTWSDRPSWLRYLDEAYLSAKFAHCFRDLNQPDTAASFALKSLNMDDAFVRGRAFNTVLLATIRVQQGELEQAAAAGNDALALTSRLRSSRSDQYLRDLKRRLAPHTAVPQVREFQQLVRSRSIDR